MKEGRVMKSRILGIVLVSGFLGMAPLLSCGGAGSSSGSGSSGSSSSFSVKGRFSSLSVSESPLLTEFSTSGTVTTVMAVAPESGNTTCKTTTVDSNGSFSLDLSPGQPWLLFFVDPSQTGVNMFLGRYSNSTQDTVVPNQSTGSLDVGTVTINSSTGVASGTTSASDVLSSLGLDSSTASTLGEADDVATRYANPDVDGDGRIDCGDSSKQFMFDFHVRFEMYISGTHATVSDIIGSFFSTSATTATYSSTGIYVAYPSTFSSVDTGSVTFVNSAVTTSEGGSIPANTATSSVTTNNFSNYKGFGPNITNTSELPSGKIVYSFGGKTLTFTNVQVPTLAQLTTPTGRIFPFVKLNKTSSSCSSNCTLSGISYQWMKKTSSGWSQASLTEIDLLVADEGGNLGFRVNNNSNKTVQFTIPKTSIEGTLDWTTSNASLSGVTAAEFTSLITTQICHLGLSYDDQLGMRYFEGINDASGTCS